MSRRSVLVGGSAAVGLGALASAGVGALVGRDVQASRAEVTAQLAGATYAERAAQAPAAARASRSWAPRPTSRPTPTSTGSTPRCASPRSRPPTGSCACTAWSSASSRLASPTCSAARSSSAPITLTCVSNEVGGDLVSTANFVGVPLRDVLLEAGVDDGRRPAVVHRASTGWTAGTPTAVVLEPHRGALLAVGMNGEALPPRARVPGADGRAGPLRLRLGHEVAGRPGADDLRRPARRLLGASAAGRSAAPIKTHVPDRRPARLRRPSRPDASPLAGTAWAQHAGVGQVEVRADDGPWQAAQLRPRSTATRGGCGAPSSTLGPGRHVLSSAAPPTRAATCRPNAGRSDPERRERLAERRLHGEPRLTACRRAERGPGRDHRSSPSGRFREHDRGSRSQLCARLHKRLPWNAVAVKTRITGRFRRPPTTPRDRRGEPVTVEALPRPRGGGVTPGARTPHPGSIPEASVARLAVYLRMLGELAEQGAETVSSEELAAATGVNSAKLRKDLSYIGSHGIRGVGYDVRPLRYQLERVLGLDHRQAVALVGVGNLGHALAGYGGFGGRGLPGHRAVRRRPGPRRHPDQRHPRGARAGHPGGLRRARRHDRHDRHARAGRAGGVRPARRGRGSSILNFAPVVLQVPRASRCARWTSPWSCRSSRSTSRAGMPSAAAVNGHAVNERRSSMQRPRCFLGREGCRHDRPRRGALAPQRARSTCWSGPPSPPPTCPSSSTRCCAASHVSRGDAVSTCNRIEVYAVVDAFHGGLADVSAVLARHAGMALPELTEHVYVHYAGSAVQHLFAVAAGLDSMVVGEAQILGQLRDAYAAADGRGHGRARAARARPAGAARRQAGARRHRHRRGGRLGRLRGPRRRRATRSAGSRGVRAVDRRRRARWAALAAAHLRRAEVAEIVVLNRSLARAAAARREHRRARHARPRGHARRARRRARRGADLLVACTGAVGTVVPVEAVAAAAPATGARSPSATSACPATSTRPSPRCPASGCRPGRAAARLADARPRRRRRARAQELVAEEAQAYLAAQRSAEVTPTVTALRRRAADVDRRRAAAARRPPARRWPPRCARSSRAPSAGSSTSSCTPRRCRSSGWPRARTATATPQALRELFELDPQTPAAVACSAPATCSPRWRRRAGTPRRPGTPRTARTAGDRLPADPSASAPGPARSPSPSPSWSRSGCAPPGHAVELVT